MTHPTAPAPAAFTPEEIETLKRFADHIDAGRKWTVRFYKALAWLGGFTIVAASAVELWRDARGQ